MPNISDELRSLADVLTEAVLSLRRVAQKLERLDLGQAGAPPGPAVLPPPIGDAPIFTTVQEPPPQINYPAAPARIDTPPRDAIEALARDIDLNRPFLPSLPRSQRSAQVRYWSGLARKLQDVRAAEFAPPRLKELKMVFGRLTSITREVDCEWVEALRPDWSTDWDVYTSMSRGRLTGTYGEITEDQERSYYVAMLKSLFASGRRVDRVEAQALIGEALEVLPETEGDLARAIGMFGRPDPAKAPPKRVRKPKEAVAEAEPRVHDVPASILALTKGRNVLMIGGQGEREEHRKAIEEALQLASLEWVVSERDQGAPWARVAERAASGKYDMFFYLTKFTSHKSAGAARAFKDAKVPVVYLSNGYSVAQVVASLQEQLETALKASS